MARSKKRGKRRIRDLVTLSLVVAFCASFLFITLSYVLNPTPIQGPDQSSLKAAIIDQLSVTQPNQTFVSSTKALLEGAGFKVDYYGWKSVTVDFYATLPTKGYKLIIFRTHSGILMNATGQPIPGNPVFLFTAEEYDPNKHTWLLLTDQVAPANPWDSPTFYFAIAPKFVKETMQGQFQNTLIIIAGCHGLYSTTLADSLIERGASVIISWDKGVTAPYMDGAALFLLRRLLVEKETVAQAVKTTMEAVGPDPSEGSILHYYPGEKGNYVFWGLTTISSNKPAETHMKRRKDRFIYRLDKDCARLRQPTQKREISVEPRKCSVFHSPFPQKSQKISPLYSQRHNNTRLIPSDVCRDASCPC